MKKPSPEKLRKKAVTLAKKIVRMRANFTCAYCGKREPNVRTHGSHIYSEGVHKSMSADLDNIIVLCFTHHLGGWNAKEPSWHNNPMEMVRWFNEQYPERAEVLRKRSQVSRQCGEIFWTDKLNELNEELQVLKLQ